jgi:hypothetical protein
MLGVSWTPSRFIVVKVPNVAEQHFRIFEKESTVGLLINVWKKPGKSKSK